MLLTIKIYAHISRNLRSKIMGNKFSLRRSYGLPAPILSYLAICSNIDKLLNMRRFARFGTLKTFKKTLWSLFKHGVNCLKARATSRMQLTLPHGSFSRFVNCTKSTKSCKALYMQYLYTTFSLQFSPYFCWCQQIYFTKSHCRG